MAARGSGQGRRRAAKPSRRPENISWLTPEVRWKHLKAGRQSTVGLTVDAAMGTIERHNLAHVDLVSNIPVGNVHAHSRDALRRVHGYLSHRSSRAPTGTSEFHSLRCVSECWSR